MRGKLNVILERHPSLKGFYWAKEKIRELYRHETREEAARVLDNLILNLKCADDSELIGMQRSTQGKCCWGLYHAEAVSTTFDKEPESYYRNLETIPCSPSM
jgi:hypothetical protein